MITKTTFTHRTFRGLAVVGLLAVPLTAFGQTTVFSTGGRKSPDLLQSLGVGSRSIAMGNAFTAIADDASATFWNPGRLGFLRRKEAMIEGRSVPQSNFFGPSANGFTSGTHPGPPQLGFFSFVYPINLTDTIGVSYTLGGYLNEDINVTLNQGTSTPVRQQRTVRNNFFTVAYGTRIVVGKIDESAYKTVTKDNADGTQSKVKRIEPLDYEKLPKIGLGVGFFTVNQDYTQNDFNALVGGGLSPTPTLTHQKGQGYGATIGITYDLKQFAPKAHSDAKDVSNLDEKPVVWQFGLTYRTKATFDGLSGIGLAFNREIPDRLALGVAYKHHFNARQAGRSAERDMIVAMDVETLGEANDSTNIDQRRRVTNFHLGLESKISPTKNGDLLDYKFPYRFGFRTNANAATNYTYYDNVVSFGLGYERYHNNKLLYTVEPTMELFTKTGMTLFTLTGRLTF